MGSPAHHTLIRGASLVSPPYLIAALLEPRLLILCKTLLRLVVSESVTRLNFSFVSDTTLATSNLSYVHGCQVFPSSGPRLPFIVRLLSLLTLAKLEKK